MGLLWLRIAFGNLFHLYVVRICDSAHFRPFKIYGVISDSDCIRKVFVNQIEVNVLNFFSSGTIQIFLEFDIGIRH